ncbi:hypothetical protein BDV18DRAFT_159296 [Aspergillus unguis]
MSCTTHATMCSHCRFQFNKIHERGTPSSILEYEPNTYPIVFKRLVDYPPGRNASVPIHEYTESLSLTLRERLFQRFKRPVAAYSSYAMHNMGPRDVAVAEDEREAGSLVLISFLIDFPCQMFGNETEGERDENSTFKAFLRGVADLCGGLEDWNCRIEVDDDLKEFLFGGLGNGWEAFISSTQDHLCMARLCWFLRREGMVTFI